MPLPLRTQKKKKRRRSIVVRRKKKGGGNWLTNMFGWFTSKEYDDCDDCHAELSECNDKLHESFGTNKKINGHYLNIIKKDRNKDDKIKQLEEEIKQLKGQLEESKQSSRLLSHRE